jgi:hypothetical protein
MTQKPQRTRDLAHYSEARRCHGDDEKTFMSVTRRRAYRDALVTVARSASRTLRPPIAFALRRSMARGDHRAAAAVPLRRFLTLRRCRVLPVLLRGVI